MLNVFFIGSGRLANNLAHALQVNNVEITGVYSRTKAHAVKFASKFKTKVYEDLTRIPANCDIYFLAVCDGAISELAAQLKVEGIVVHCSGMMPQSCLGNHKHKGVFWPIQSFSNDYEVDLKNVPVCIEAGEEEDIRILEVIADKISRRVIQVSEEERQKLHLAAVLVNNFSNHLFTLAQSILPPNLNFGLLKPLIHETANKIENLPPQEAQTGPAIRRDLTTIARHEELLKDNKKLLEIYRLLTLSIQDTID